MSTLAPLIIASFQKIKLGISFCTVLVSITAGGNPTLGQQYTLTCNVNLASGVTGTPTVQWVGPVPITGGDFTVSNTSPYTLTINPLRQSHVGQYTCQTAIGGDTGTASVMVDITGWQLSTLNRNVLIRLFKI